jgi:hypothetical protein
MQQPGFALDTLLSSFHITQASVINLQHTDQPFGFKYSVHCKISVPPKDRNEESYCLAPCWAAAASMSFWIGGATMMTRFARGCSERCTTANCSIRHPSFSG